MPVAHRVSKIFYTDEDMTMYFLVVEHEGADLFIEFQTRSKLELTEMLLGAMGDTDYVNLIDEYAQRVSDQFDREFPEIMEIAA